MIYAGAVQSFFADDNVTWKTKEGVQRESGVKRGGNGFVERVTVRSVHTKGIVIQLELCLYGYNVMYANLVYIYA